MERDYYKILEVERDASTEKIKQSYRRQSLKWHPDKNNGSKESEDMFKLIAEAYSVLSDPGSREAYDASLSEGTEYQEQAIDPELAAAMFFREMVNLAYELTMQNIPKSRIAEELIKRGCPSEIAMRIARGVEGERKSAVRKSAGRAFIWAIVLIIIGIIVTAISASLAEPGGTYIVTVGLFISGGIQLIRAIYFLISGRAPRSRE